MRRFGARHERSPAQAGGERRLSLAFGQGGVLSCPLRPLRDHAVENALRELPEAYALGMQPVVELGRGSGLEVLQQLVLIQRRGRFETPQILFARERLEARRRR